MYTATMPVIFKFMPPDQKKNKNSFLRDWKSWYFTCLDRARKTHLWIFAFCFPFECRSVHKLITQYSAVSWSLWLYSLNSAFTVRMHCIHAIRTRVWRTSWIPVSINSWSDWLSIWPGQKFTIPAIGLKKHPTFNNCKYLYYNYYTLMTVYIHTYTLHQCSENTCLRWCWLSRFCIPV